MVLDQDGYPLPESLEAIRSYDLITQPLAGLIDLIRETWWKPGRQCILDGNKLELHTAGWSGNEETIDTLEENHLFWSRCWQKYRMGGHYYFTLVEFPGDKGHGISS